MEMLLYSCIPRKDTNVIAHRLINRFSTCENVLNASAEELCKIKGVGEHTAITLKFYGQLLEYIDDEETKTASEDSSCPRGCDVTSTSQTTS